jgi:hypothetical protein
MVLDILPPDEDNDTHWIIELIIVIAIIGFMITTINYTISESYGITFIGLMFVIILTLIFMVIKKWGH